jgi:hypothetical protein
VSLWFTDSFTKKITWNMTYAKSKFKFFTSVWLVKILCLSSLVTYNNVNYCQPGCWPDWTLLPTTPTVRKYDGPTWSHPSSFSATELSLMRERGGSCSCSTMVLWGRSLAPREVTVTFCWFHIKGHWLMSIVLNFILQNTISTRHNFGICFLIS